MHVTIIASDTFFLYFFSKKYSVATPKKVTTAKSNKTLHPKKYIAETNNGSKEITTVLIIFCFEKYFDISFSNKRPPPQIIIFKIIPHLFIPQNSTINQLQNII